MGDCDLLTFYMVFNSLAWIKNSGMALTFYIPFSTNGCLLISSQHKFVTFVLVLYSQKESHRRIRERMCGTGCGSFHLLILQFGLEITVFWVLFFSSFVQSLTFILCLLCLNCFFFSLNCHMTPVQNKINMNYWWIWPLEKWMFI